ncbi:hypothetical protein ACFQI7_28230 [Paenibacillus allorhizosphaerae]|uniref:Uncharacterized protein n=1 Tax=Paenibacillus allorhizosphaerae TaxID=2849866 RepID=A0ABN7TVB6_9BACL|nr:hypothetical protein [Paenibacillus allorhizosphaerae]CAG7651425.1 hypothetical protein PAECIP111802_04960 [Paenibacillus allorhizosphaerae]
MSHFLGLNVDTLSDYLHDLSMLITVRMMVEKGLPICEDWKVGENILDQVLTTLFGWERIEEIPNVGYFVDVVLTEGNIERVRGILGELGDDNTGECLAYEVQEEGISLEFYNCNVPLYAVFEGLFNLSELIKKIANSTMSAEVLSGHVAELPTLLKRRLRRGVTARKASGSPKTMRQ